MKVTVEQIHDRGLTIAFETQTPWARSAASTALEGTVVEVSGELKVRRYQNDLAVTGEASVSVERTCDRCGGDVTLTVDGPLELTYVPNLRGEISPGGSRELVASELDLGLYEEGSLDLGLVLQEHLALQLPWRVTCDLPNVTPSGEACNSNLLKPPERGPDPRWAALAALVPDASEEN